MSRRVILLGLMSFGICWTAEQVFVACEGNFYSDNGSLWTITDEGVYEYPDNPIGDIVQSVLVNENQLFVIVNSSSNIQVFDITDNGLVPTHLIDTEYSGPREMLVYENYLYFTNWYTADIKKLNLITWEIDSEIILPGLPEDIIMVNGSIFTSITMNSDWSDGHLVIEIDSITDTIVGEFDVGPGPGELLEFDGDIYVARIIMIQIGMRIMVHLELKMMGLKLCHMDLVLHVVVVFINIKIQFIDPLMEELLSLI